jgi:hypothetical protein
MSSNPEVVDPVTPSMMCYLAKTINAFFVTIILVEFPVQSNIGLLMKMKVIGSRFINGLRFSQQS